MTTYLVGAVVATIVYYIGKEVVGAYAHVSDENLLAFWNGTLKAKDRKAFRRTTEHLATCVECRDRLDEIRKTNAGPGATDPLINRRY